MGQIKQLAKQIADKIAAGEVIERPLSVVKELLENSLDAGADFVEIEIQDGGTRLIRIRDNGKGMDADDLHMAFTRHATSKIDEFQDLFSLTTFGFRGEALPSIAIVSQVEMQSCTKDDEIGHKITIDGGVEQDWSETAMIPGTVVEVRNLFYNIPARRKFLKSNSYETGLIGDLVSKYALGHPGVRFRYVSNNQLQLDTAGLTTTEERMAYIYGSNLESLIVPIPRTEVGANRWIEAWLVREEVTRNNRGQEVFFVNGRLIKSSELSHSLEEGYYTLIPKGRFPIAVVQLYLPGTELDVNIHPAKTEIKINGYDQFNPKIVEVLKDALWEASITKNAFLPEGMKAGIITDVERTQKDLSRHLSNGSAARETAKKIEKKVKETFTKKAGDIVAEPEKLLKWGGEDQSARTNEPVQLTEQGELFDPKDTLKPKTGEFFTEPRPSEELKEPIMPTENTQEEQALPPDFPQVPEDLPSAFEGMDVTETKPKPAKKEPEEKTDEAYHDDPDAVMIKGVGKLSIIGQLHNTFILAQSAEALYIIDQHTLHERINYEKFMKAEDRKEVVSQPLLVPITINVSVKQDSILMQNIFVLKDLGFVLENFGERCYLIRSLPLGLDEVDNKEEMFMDLLHDLEKEERITPAVVKEKILTMASCKQAVKAHWKLTDVEMRTLLHDLSSVENAHTCPHGRPIIYKITMSELYKIFQRGAFRG